MRHLSNMHGLSEVPSPDKNYSDKFASILNQPFERTQLQDSEQTSGRRTDTGRSDIRDLAKASVEYQQKYESRQD